MSDPVAELQPVDPEKVRPIKAADWLPAGRVLRDWVLAPEPVTCIMGPLGSGKTTAGFIKGLICSCVVPRSPVDGVRYARGLVVRDTYRNLEQNTIASWHERFPQDLGTWKGGGGGDPAKAVIDFEIAPGEILHMEVIFAALGDHNVKTFCDGFQANWCFANGLDALPADFITFMETRLGRWPPPKHRPPDWKKFEHYSTKLFADMNAPDLDNWTYGNEEKNLDGFVERVPHGWRLFRQPGGRDPDAENLENLRDGYYEKMLSKPKWFVHRFVDNKFGYSRSGTPVYPEWNEALHVAPADLKYNPRRKLIIGIDAGRDPRAVAMQRDLSGFLNVLAELVPESRMGAKAFGKVLSEWVATEFPDQEAEIEAWADPAAADPTQDTDEDAVWIETVAEVSKIPIKPAPTNALGPRLEAVRSKLAELIEGFAAFRLSRKCKILRRGFASGYRFGKEKHHGEERDTVTPVKNLFSHPHDALQYGALGSSDWKALKGRDEEQGKRHVEETEWNPHKL